MMEDFREAMAYEEDEWALCQYEIQLTMQEAAPTIYFLDGEIDHVQEKEENKRI